MLLVKNSHTLADGLVIFNMLNALDEVANIELFLKLEMENCSLIFKFDIEVGAVL